MNFSSPPKKVRSKPAALCHNGTIWFQNVWLKKYSMFVQLGFSWWQTQESWTWLWDKSQSKTVGLSLLIIMGQERSKKLDIMKCNLLSVMKSLALFLTISLCSQSLSLFKMIIILSIQYNIKQSCYYHHQQCN